MAAPRDSLLFLQNGTLAAGLVNATSGGLEDSVPDDRPHPVAYFPGACASTTTRSPAIVFTALGSPTPGWWKGRPSRSSSSFPTPAQSRVVRGRPRLHRRPPPRGARGPRAAAQHGTAVLAFNWTAAAGPHNVTAKSFPGGVSRTLQVNIPGAVAVLTITEAQAVPPNPEQGHAFQVRVTVRNGGNAPSPEERSCSRRARGCLPPPSSGRSRRATRRRSSLPRASRRSERARFGRRLTASTARMQPPMSTWRSPLRRRSRLDPVLVLAVVVAGARRGSGSSPRSS